MSILLLHVVARQGRFIHVWMFILCPHPGQVVVTVRVIPTCIVDELLVLSRDALLPYCYGHGGASLLSWFGPGLSGAPEFLRGGVGQERRGCTTTTYYLQCTPLAHYRLGCTTPPFRSGPCLALECPCQTVSNHYCNLQLVPNFSLWQLAYLTNPWILS